MQFQRQENLQHRLLRFSGSKFVFLKELGIPFIGVLLKSSPKLL